ncbi:MAG: hypothetical protein ACI3XJ_07625 [Oscillospiraceae bacterium]
MGRRGEKLTVLLLTASLILGLAACGEKAGEEQTDGTVYVPEFMEFDLSELGIESVNTGCCDGIYVYILADAGKEVEVTDPETGDAYTNYEFRTSIFRLPLDGGEVTELENFTPLGGGDDEPVPDRESYSYIESLRVDADGALWVTETLEEYIYDVPEDFDPETDSIWNYEMLEGRSSRVQRKLDESGAEIDRVDTSALEEKLGLREQGVYIGNTLMDNEGNFYVLAEVYSENTSETKIVVLDKDLNNLFEIKGENLWGQMILLGDGSVAMSSYIYDQFTGEGGQVLRIIDKKAGTWSEKEYPMPTNVGSVYPGSGRFLFYYDNGDSLYGYNAQKEAGEKILSWSSADINRSDLAFFTFLEDGRVAAMTRTWGENGMETEIAILTEQDASVLADRTILTYATMYLSYDMRERIIDFNKSQSDYRIEIRDYSEFNTADDYNAGLTKLNTEIIAGQVPDILDTNGLPIRQYGAKGLLENLWPYIEDDEELGGREGMMENVLKAAEQDGKLYQIFNSFNIRTVVGAARVVGEEMSWTLEDLRSALATMPEGCTIFGEGDTKENMLSNVMAMQMDNFVDWTTGECQFDSEEFIALLEFCNSFPLKYDWSSVDFDDYEDENTRIAAGKQMLSSDYLYDFQTIQVDQFIFGGEITFVGFPREDGGVGSSFVIEGGLAMSTTCKDKEGAWAFMRETVTPQSSEDSEYFYFNGWGFPVNRQDFDRMAEQAMTPEYILDENGEPMLDENGEPMEQSQGGWGWGDGTYFEAYSTSQEEYDQFMALYEAIDSIYSYDEKIYSIVLDVAQRYFNDDITVEMAADQIQSRVKLYVNENL